MKLPESTKNIINSQEDPTKIYLDLNKNLIQGYLNTLQQDGPEKLAMSEETYAKSTQYLTLLQKGIEKIETEEKNTKYLTQTTTCPSGTCNSTNENEGYKTDLSAYVQ